MPHNYTPKDLARFYSKIRIADNGCHEWTGKPSHGFGRFYSKQNGDEMARRVAWVIANGPFSSEMYILSRCLNPLCVNPEHLFLGTKDAVEERRTTRTESHIARFYSMIRVMPNGCHDWTGTQKSNGYGMVGFSAYKNVLAHRMAWEIVNGPIPEGLQICHHCDRPICCNVEHLFLGTQADNNHDAVQKGRNARGAKQHSAKLTEDTVREARALFASGMKLGAIGERLGVNRSTIGYVIRRDTWRHIP